MAEVVAAYPGAPLALFGRYGIGSRDKFGFRPEQTLREVLARHLIFDEGPVLEYLAAADAEEREVMLAASEAAGLPVLDVRGRADFELYRLPGARLLDAESAAWLLADPERPVLLVCREGSMAATAARHFRSKGHRGVKALSGGLEAWAALYPDFPSYGGEVRLLPGGGALRWRLERSLCEGLARVGEALVYGDVITVVRPGMRDWQEAVPALRQWAAGLEEVPAAPWPADLQVRVESALARDVAPRLVEHKGTVELARLDGLVAYVRLGGGCQGCSSAGVTLSEEVAAAVFTAAPEILDVRDATDHASGVMPHH